MIDLRRVEAISAVAADGLEQPVEDLLDGEDFLFADAEQVVVVGGPLDDRAGGVFQVGRFVDDDRRIARAGDDRPFLARSAARATPGPPVTTSSRTPR